MTFAEVCAKLNVESYIPEMEEAYREIIGKEFPYTKELIEHLQEKYQLFGEHYPAVLAGWEDTLKKPERLVMIHTAIRYLEREKGSSHAIRSMPRPETDGTPAGDMMLLFVHLPQVERGMEMYRSRGFSEETIRRLFRCLNGGMNVHRTATGRSGLNANYFGWCAHYMYCRLFNHEGFNYELKQFPAGMIILKNKTTGEILPVEGANKKVHRDGRILGTYGFEEEEGAFETSFEETDTHFIGNPVRNCLIQKEKECFSKEEWEVKLREGDDVISIHIPKGTDLSPEFVAASTASALKFVEKYYDEFHPKGFMCSSWLLEPSIESILGKPGKISGFGNQFVRYPNKSVGKEMFSFVFGPGAAQRPWEELAEDTSLQRALKELYLSGKRIYAWSGILI